MKEPNPGQPILNGAHQTKEAIAEADRIHRENLEKTISVSPETRHLSVWNFIDNPYSSSHEYQVRNSPFDRTVMNPRNHSYLARVLPAIAVTSALTTPARASFLHGEALDKAADIMSWVVLVLVPVVAIAVFWLLHIMPEKIAEKRRHPQAKAIQCLCLLSLFFGGLLWPIAWLWAYSKPVLHKLAYGTDVDDSHGHPSKEEIEITVLRARVAELESAIEPPPNKA